MTVTADVDDDPAAAWTEHRDQLQALLDRPEAAEETFESEMFGGAMPLGVALERFVTGDVLVHTWDLATATGQDQTIDAEFAAGMYEGMQPMDAMLRQVDSTSARASTSPTTPTRSQADRLHRPCP
ncbi:MAG: hypothetical protein R2697_15140 [Ilumatobacteraceae bacterium]